MSTISELLEMENFQNLVNKYNCNEGFRVIWIHEDIELLNPDYDLNDYDASGKVESDGGRYIELWVATSGIDEYEFLKFLLLKGYKQYGNLHDQGESLMNDFVPSIKFKSDEDAIEFIDELYKLIRTSNELICGRYSNIVVKPDDYKKFKEDINEFLEKENFKILINNKLYSKI